MILVTGGAGYAGSIVVQELLGSGYEVLVVDNLQQGYWEPVPEGTRFVKGNPRDSAACPENVRT